MLSTDFDITATREAVKAIKRLAAAPAFSDYIVAPYGAAFAAATTDANIDAYVRGLTTTIFHPTGTSSMASASSDNGVVNPDLTVKGAEGLRVVDASVFVSPPVSDMLSTRLNGPFSLSFLAVIPQDLHISSRRGLRISSKQPHNRPVSSIQ